MSLRITCPACKTSLSVDESLRGKKIRCAKCDEPLSIPAARKTDEGVFDAKGHSAPPPLKRPTRDEDEKAPARPAKGGKAGIIVLVLLLVGGGVALVGVLAIFLVCGGGGLLLFRSGPKDGGGPVAVNEAPQAVDNQPVVPVANNNPPPQIDPPAGPMPDKIDDAAINRVKQATVYLRVTMPNGQKSEGSGFLAVEPGVVITNAHVLGMLQAQSQPPRQVEVFVYHGEPNQMHMQGQVLGVDRATDLAVVRIPVNGLPAPLAVQSARNLATLQKVYIFGYPLGAAAGRNVTVNTAEVSSLLKDAAGYLTQVKLNGDMQPGNSGGPVVDARGQVVGVSVAIIKGTRINFAVPGDFVKLILDGRLAENSYGEPYLAGDGKKMMTVRYQCLDPLARIRSMRVEVWAGPNGAPRPFSYQQPAAQPGDGARQTVNVTYQNGVGTAEVPLPALQPGQVYWMQPVLVDGKGVTQWFNVNPLAASNAPPLERQAASLQWRPDRQLERTLKVKSTYRLTVFQGQAKFTGSMKLETDLLELLRPDPQKPGHSRAHLTFGRCQASEEEDGKPLPIPGQATQVLGRSTPHFQLESGTGRLRVRTTSDFSRVNPLPLREQVLAMSDQFCNAFEATSLEIPSRQVQPLEAWQATAPMFVNTGKAKKEVVDLKFVCTYEGSRTNNGRREAYIRLTGHVQPRNKVEASGRISGRLLFDVDNGYIADAVLSIASELDIGNGAAQLLFTTDVGLSRNAGNQLGIVAQLPKDPPPGGENPPPPGKGIVVLNSTVALTAKSPFDQKLTTSRCRMYAINMTAGKTYVVEMRSAVIDPYLRLLNPAGTEVAFDDDSGGGLNARIVYRPQQSGVHRIIATTFRANETGLYTLSVREE